MNTTLLSKILNYEKEVFDTYVSKRQGLLEGIQKIEINTLDKSQLLIFIENIKNIIDPLKTSTANIDNFMNGMCNENNFTETQFILFYLLFGDFFFKTGGSSEDSEDILSEPESLSESVLESESV